MVDQSREFRVRLSAARKRVAASNECLVQPCADRRRGHTDHRLWNLSGCRGARVETAELASVRAASRLALAPYRDAGKRNHHTPTDRHTERAGGFEHAPQKLISNPRPNRIVLRAGD